MGMYLLFGLCRLLFVLFNYRYFSYGGAGTLVNWIWGGLVFDTVAIFYVNAVLYPSGYPSFEVQVQKMVSGNPVR